MAFTRQGAIRPAARFIRIVAIFLLAGPPAGAIAGWVARLGIGLLHNDLQSSDLVVLPLFIYLSYVAAPYALVCGIIHAVLATWLRWSSIWVPLIAGSVLRVPMVLAVSAPVWMHLHYELPRLERDIALWVGAMLGASLICWRLSRRLVRGA
jgi:hypothetical protein